MAWTARFPHGPRPITPPAAFTAKPDPGWVALLRHGSDKVPAGRLGTAEDEVRIWAWECLLQGDGGPWMGIGSLLLDLPERLAWICHLGAVDAEGRLHLPPYLDALLPEPLHLLPLGWWERLLGGMDTEGRLYPLPGETAGPWLEALRSSDPQALMPLLLQDGCPEVCRPHAHALPDGTWMINPALRAWVRGWGPTTQALAPLAPQTLAVGAPPTPLERDLLNGCVPSIPLPPGWTELLEADFKEARQLSPPEASGHPILDRIRMRWTGDPPEPSPGYPQWGDLTHPCADPFHWMAEGFHAFTSGHVQEALHAFARSYAHFRRLRSTFWAQRAASNAWTAAVYWADHRSMEIWTRLRGSQNEASKATDHIYALILKGEYQQASIVLKSIINKFPDNILAWEQLAASSFVLNKIDTLESSLPHISEKSRHGWTLIINEAIDYTILNNIEMRLSHEMHQVRSYKICSPEFWHVWNTANNQSLRLETALVVLEHLPEQRTAERLLAVQAIAERTRGEKNLARVRALWPLPPARDVPDPEAVILHWLAHRSHPTWVVVEGRVLGGGDVTLPEGLLSRLQEVGDLAPLQAEGRLWLGHVVHWKGAPVGHVLTCQALEAPVQAAGDLELVAPWLAALRPDVPVPPEPLQGQLLTDGSEPLASVIRECSRVAPTDLPVLILGPSGSGKELMAKEIHARSGRTGALVPVNCSAFAEGLLESELFGHVKGAFTGADRDRRGAIEEAQSGTLFLDEVGDMSPRIQSMFLRVLQEREVRRVGSDRVQRIDVRFIAATHKSLDQLVSTGHFRQDLLWRLQGCTLSMPSLGARRHEFPHLIPLLVAQAAKDLRRPAPALAPGLPEALAHLPWPGNFRQLRYALDRALLRCGKGPLETEHFPEMDHVERQSGTWDEATRAFQRRLLTETLERCNHKVAEAARHLGLSRPALYAAMQRLGVDLPAERYRHESRVKPRVAR